MNDVIDLSKSIAYVQQNGSLLERARLAYLLERVDPPENIIRPLLDIQNKDGGFPSRPRPGSRSAVDSTLTALWQLLEFGRVNTPTAERALDFLAEMQSYDGSWDENPDLPPYDLPPWIVPGDLATHLYLSAYSTYWLGLSGAHPDAFEQGIQYLSNQQDAAGSLPGYLHTTWIGTAAFMMAGKAASAELGMAYLESRPLADWGDDQIAWALDFLGRAGLPKAHPFYQGLIDALVQRQAPDGSWSSEDGPMHAAAATVSAIKVIKAYQKD